MFSRSRIGILFPPYFRYPVSGSVDTTTLNALRPRQETWKVRMRSRATTSESKAAAMAKRILSRPLKRPKLNECRSNPTRARIGESKRHALRTCHQSCRARRNDFTGKGLSRVATLPAGITRLILLATFVSSGLLRTASRAAIS